MTFELALAAGMACTSRPQRRMDEDYLLAIVASYGSTVGSCARTAGASTIKADIASAIADPDNYEPGEARPNAAAIAAMNELLAATETEVKLPVAQVRTYYGEIAVTWEKGNRILRLVTYSDGRQPLLYFCTDAGEILTRGETIQPVGAQQLVERLEWLNQ